MISTGSSFSITSFSSFAAFAVDTLYQWKLVDRSAKGACPMLEIKCWGPDTGGLAYYVAGYNGNYFYGKLQGYVFYKQ